MKLETVTPSIMITKENIETVLPHRAPFIMIDNLIRADAKEFETDFIVQHDNIFLKNNNEDQKINT